MTARPGGGGNPPDARRVAQSMTTPEQVARLTAMAAEIRASLTATGVLAPVDPALAALMTRTTELVPAARKESMNVRRPHLDAIRKRAAAATPGTWKIGSKFGCGVLGSSVVVLSGELPPIDLDPHRNGRADAAFIAHARQDIPALLAEIDRLQAELDDRPYPPLSRVNNVMTQHA